MMEEGGALNRCVPMDSPAAIKKIPPRMGWNSRIVKEPQILPPAFMRGVPEGRGESAYLLCKQAKHPRSPINGGASFLINSKFHPEWDGTLLFRVDNIDVTSTAHYCDDDCLMPTPVPGAFIRQWILPRPKKVSPGHFFTPAAPGPAFRIPHAHQKKFHPDWGGTFLAESVGFEPTVPCGITGFQDRLVKPLRQLSITTILYPVRLEKSRKTPPIWAGFRMGGIRRG